jgi:hypothetical protein
MADSFAQPCLQPGSLVSVFNTYKGKYEYLVFKFIAPYNSKGTLSGAPNTGFDINLPAGTSFHKIQFLNVPNFCADKWQLQLPQRKLLDFKTPEMSSGNVSYVFALAPGARIVSHFTYRHQIYYFVKIRIE